ncbi:MAG: hypothetical protein KIT09_13030 [Bryobacteraceae bacterium]|nr:hypothetical protein [Bryobacteraceae bacterium]
MKRFTFPLERVRLWRKTQIDIEYAKLQELFAELRRLECEVADLHQTEQGARKALLAHAVARQPLEGAELERLDDFHLYARQQDGLLARNKEALLGRIAAQRERLIEARRKLSLLDKLKERASDQWQREFEKEIETLASEQFVARWKGSE